MYKEIIFYVSSYHSFIPILRVTFRLQLPFMSCSRTNTTATFRADIKRPIRIIHAILWAISLLRECTLVSNINTGCDTQQGLPRRYQTFEVTSLSQCICCVASHPLLLRQGFEVFGLSLFLSLHDNVFLFRSYAFSSTFDYPSCPG